MIIRRLTEPARAWGSSVTMTRPRRIAAAATPAPAATAAPTITSPFVLLFSGAAAALEDDELLPEPPEDPPDELPEDPPPEDPPPEDPPPEDPPDGPESSL